MDQFHNSFENISIIILSGVVMAEMLVEHVTSAQWTSSLPPLWISHLPSRIELSVKKVPATAAVMRQARVAAKSALKPS